MSGLFSATTPIISSTSNGSTVVSLSAPARSSLNGNRGHRCAVLLEHPDVSLDDQAGVFLVEFIVAVGGNSSTTVFQISSPCLNFSAALENRPSCRPESPRRRSGEPGSRFGRLLRLAPLFPVAVVHLVGPAVGPVSLVLVELVIIRPGQHASSSLIVSRTSLAVARTSLCDWNTCSPNSSPTRPGLRPFVLGHLAERGRNSVDAHLLEARGVTRLPWAGIERKAMSSGRPLRWGVGST